MMKDLNVITIEELNTFLGEVSISDLTHPEALSNLEKKLAKSYIYDPTYKNTIQKAIDSAKTAEKRLSSLISFSKDELN